MERLQRAYSLVLNFSSMLFGWLASLRLDRSISLSNGYRLIRTNTDFVLLVRGEKHAIHMLIKPDITEYKVIGNLVVGLAIPPFSPNVNTADIGNWGYFLLDTKTGELHKGLCRADWESILAEHKLTERPRLREPSRFGKIFGSP